ncbi:DEHA2F18150p [Debaryomyces hansenii CBS767]|uniref:DEHA2F18150p n=1 Tax=Debaryomyces hansenii (strain ATCC 36239 / CBS 767 / BCRC 21394 / JCM 1990 / NBRC 0083 / IGC 2968) TaxID=284592 RepID=Q6BKX4_DEBHA|nr:DEHA2F18150p [Debaryomyces hansenii CBS767]CAG89530.2 DEHA2F18150p [Debaryomyces hansenii CBS767]|eukprot:XP_461147.2 DEHA2F18150p [Debaryomyces hansenii CBS767]
MSSDHDDTIPLLSDSIPENPIRLPEQELQRKESAQPAVSKNSQANRSISKINQSPKIGLQRTSRTTQKLKLLPEDPPNLADENDEEVYSQVTRIKDTPARKDAETLGKSQRDLLPRVTAYCTCGSYKMKDLLRWLKDRKRIHNTNPKLFDECLYTPFTYKDWRSEHVSQDDQHHFIRLADEGGEIDIGKRNDIFIFEYGVIIMWGYTPKEEAAFLEDLAKFESEKLSAEDIQVEEFNYYITKSYQPRIYNDFITIRDDSNYMLKLSISHALAQSVKISLFEELVDNTIEDTEDIPQQIAQTGKVEMTKDEIMKSIGELFILRININLHGSVLDSPELMWAEPHLEPIYQATRGYLEINQRVELLNQRLEVISDLLQMLKEQLGHSHEENLEFIVVVLVAVEVLVSIINIMIDILTY